LLRLATNGTGVLQPGALHPDLIGRLAQEAAKTAQHVLNMCVRAIDYCPPVDITFGEFLRAIITADIDLVEDDYLHYRVSFIEGFRKRGIYPSDVRTLSIESLVWRGCDNDERRPSEALQSALEQFRSQANLNIYAGNRKATFELQRRMRGQLHDVLQEQFEAGSRGADDARYFGLDPKLRNSAGKMSFRVNIARFAYRTKPDSGVVPQLIFNTLQIKKVRADRNNPGGGIMPFLGGATVIVDLYTSRIKYCVRKSFTSQYRLEAQQAFAMEGTNSLRDIYFHGDHDKGKEPFAALHRGV
jgi:hypothetical protein